ncbi:unnamed protein product [Rotaria magnacalcarata]
MASNTTAYTQSNMVTESSSDSDSDFILDQDYVAASTPNVFDTSNDTSYSSTGTTTTMTSEISTLSRPYPPINCHGAVDEHDKPYREFGEMKPKAIALLKKFRLPVKHVPYCEPDPTIRVSRKNNRLYSRKLAISSFSDRTKEETYKQVLQYLEVKKIPVRYVCVAREIVTKDTMPRIHIQIVFRGKPAIHAQFMDRFLNCQCEYHVTIYANAWNEYMKQAFSFIEYGLFKGSDKKGVKLWPNSSTTKKGACLTDDIATEAFKLSKNSVPNALDMLVEKVPAKCLTGLRGIRVNLELYYDQHKIEELRSIARAKTYCWPDSFQDITSELGKTSFALSLPSMPNYYRGVWSIIYWNNDATYMIFDDIPWRSIDQKGYPAKKDLLIGQLEVCVSDKYCKNKKIIVDKPAIILLNHADDQPLLNPRTQEEREDLEFWQKRAIIRVLEPNEHFYKPKPKTPSPENKIYTVDGIPLFDEFRRAWREKQQQKALPPAPSPSPPPTSMIMHPQPENQLRRQRVRSSEYPYEL